jgi:hypothetical protein
LQQFRDEYKIEDAYKWATDISVEEIPIEFTSIKNAIINALKLE